MKIWEEKETVSCQWIGTGWTINVTLWENEYGELKITSEMSSRSFDFKDELIAADRWDASNERFFNETLDFCKNYKAYPSSSYEANEILLEDFCYPGDACFDED